MKLEEQVCSLDIAKRLKDLGTNQESLWYWLPNTNATRGQPEMVVAHSSLPDYQRADFFSAFTVAELGEMLPPLSEGYRSVDGRWVYSHESLPKTDNAIKGVSEADARSKLLIYFLQSKEGDQLLDAKQE
jgi:hypothetical protein